MYQYILWYLILYCFSLIFEGYIRVYTDHCWVHTWSSWFYCLPALPSLFACQPFRHQPTHWKLGLLTAACQCLPVHAWALALAWSRRHQLNVVLISRFIPWCRTVGGTAWKCTSLSDCRSCEISKFIWAQKAAGSTAGTLAICCGGVRNFAWQQFPRNCWHTISQRFKTF